MFPSLATLSFTSGRDAHQPNVRSGIGIHNNGTGGNEPDPILQINRARGKPVINTIAMQTTTGAAEFAALAKGTKGTFTIVAKDGSPISGDDYFKDPAKYKANIEGK